MKILRVDSSHRDFQKLCNLLDSDLDERYGLAQSKYDRHNVIEENGTVILGYLHGAVVAGGCFKQIEGKSIEIKRMYVVPSYRRKGLSSRILSELGI